MVWADKAKFIFVFLLTSCLNLFGLGIRASLHLALSKNLEATTEEEIHQRKDLQDAKIYMCMQIILLWEGQ